jgi:hypothetical protein
MLHRMWASHSVEHVSCDLLDFGAALCCTCYQYYSKNSVTTCSEYHYRLVSSIIRPHLSVLMFMYLMISCRWSETTSLNCGHQRVYCSSTGDTWVWRIIVEWYRQEKLLICPPELTVIPAELFRAKQEELAKEVMDFSLRSISFIFIKFL